MIDLSVDQLPAALRPREFKVGDRVRIRISPECDFHAEPIEAPYSHAVNGQTGTVSLVPSASRVNPMALEVHPVYVRFDGALIEGTPIYGGVFAAIELEPIGDES